MKVKRILSGILLAILIVTSFVMFNIQSALGENRDDWWNCGWTYRRQINIIENSGYSLVNFPIEVSFRHNGHIQPDGKDIRIVDGDSEIPYCIIELNSTHVTVMFQVNVTALSTKKVYIYYGNPNASTPNYPLVPLTIVEGNTGYAIIDNLVYIGWRYTKWGWDYDNNEVVLWTDYKIDFNQNGDPADDNDLITDVEGRVGGIGRYRIDYGGGVVRSIGLGNYQGFNQTPVFVDIYFDNAALRVYKGNVYVQTTQADKLFMFGQSWDYAKYCGGPEENIIDGLNTNGPPWDPLWHILYDSTINPGWMAYRNSFTGDVIAGLGFNIGENYSYHFSAKETGAWDRSIHFDIAFPEYLDAHDQPSRCRIYWCGDNTNGYSNIETIAAILANLPFVSIGHEETPGLAITCTVRIDPDMLNLKSKGKWISAYIELPKGYKVADIDISTIMLNKTIPAEPNLTAIGDYDKDGVQDLMVKFNRTAVSEFILSMGIKLGNVTLTIVGKLNDGTEFKGSYTIRIRQG